MVKKQGVGGLFLLQFDPKGNSRAMSKADKPHKKKKKSNLTIWTAREIFLNLDHQIPGEVVWEGERLSCRSDDLYTEAIDTSQAY